MANPVITAARKGVSSRSPYTGKTFQELTENIVGRDGYLSGGSASDDGSFITIEPFRMVSRGIIGESIANSVVDVPVLSGPWYIVASLADDDPDSGVVVQSTRSLEVASTGVVIATKTGDVWRNPSSVDVRGAAGKAVEVGVENGFSSTYQNTGDAYDGTDGTTVVEKIRSNKGLLVTGDGKRIVSEGVTGQSARQFEETPPSASTLGNRTDKIVMRELEPFTRAPEYLVGGTHSGTSGRVAMGTASWQPGYYGERKGTKDEQWWVWADGSDIHVYGGTGGGGPTDFGDVNHVLAGGTKLYPIIAGRRDSDGALVVLYVDTANLFMVSFSATTGAIVDAAASIESLPNGIGRINAVLDQDDDVRIVFEYADVTRQTWMMRASVAVATFGASTMTPDYVQRSGATGDEELRPQIRVCRNGISHICYLSGASISYGTSIVYVKLDSNNALISAESFLVASDVGIPGAQDEDGLQSAGVYNRLYNFSMTLTPHDEVYAAVEAKNTGETFRTALLLFSPELAVRTGFGMVLVEDNSAYRMRDVGMTHTDDGGLIASLRHFGASLEQGIYVFHLDSQPGKNGTLANLIKNVDEVAGEPTTSTTDPLLLTEMGPAGELAHAWRIGTSVERLHTPGWEGELSDGHPKDTLLHSVNIPLHATELIEEQGLQLFNARPKGLNSPVIVGDGGDYQGYDSLRKAIDVVSRSGGGTVIVRCGCHEGGTLDLPHNVSLIGENGATIAGDVSLYGTTVAATVIGNIIEDSTVVPPSSTEPGSWVLMTGAGNTGWHQIAKRLRNRSDGGYRVQLMDAPGAIAPVGDGAIFYASSVRIENLTIDGQFTVRRTRDSLIRNITLTKQSVTIFTGQANFDCKFEDFDLRPTVATGLLCNVYEGDGNTYKNFVFEDDEGYFEFKDTEQNITLLGGRGDHTNPAAAQTWRAVGTRTTPIYAVGTEGPWFPSGNEDLIISTVGRLVSTAEGLGAMKLGDDGTRAATGPLELTGATAAFNGATPQVIADSINERLLKAGDTMTGDLTMGANIPTDGTTRNLGATGVAANRFNAFINTMNVIGLATLEENAILKKTSTLGGSLLGSVADAGVPRIEAVASTFAGVELTLIEEVTAPAGVAYRRYVTSFGRLIETINASWNNTTNLWSKTLAGSEAFLRQINEYNTEIGYRPFDDDTDWGSSGWLLPRSEIVEIPIHPMMWRESGSWTGPGSAFGLLNTQWSNVATSGGQLLQIPILGVEVGDWLHGFELYIETNNNPDTLNGAIQRIDELGNASQRGAKGEATASLNYHAMDTTNFVGSIPIDLEDQYVWYAQYSHTGVASSSFACTFAKALVSKPWKNFGTPP